MLLPLEKFFSKSWSSSASSLSMVRERIGTRFFAERVESGLGGVEAGSFDLEFGLFLLDFLHLTVQVVVVQLIVAYGGVGDLGVGEHLAVGLAAEIVGLLVEVLLETVHVLVRVDVGPGAWLVFFFYVVCETALLVAELALVPLLQLVDHRVLQVGLPVVLSWSGVLLQEGLLEPAVHG